MSFSQSIKFDVKSSLRLLSFLKKMICSPSEKTRYQSVKIVANVAGLGKDHAFEVFKDKELFNKIVNIFENDTEQIRGHACYFFKCLVDNLEEPFETVIFKENLIKPLIPLLESDDDEVIMDAVSCLFGFLVVSEKNKKPGARYCEVAIEF